MSKGVFSCPKRLCFLIIFCAKRNSLIFCFLLLVMGEGRKREREKKERGKYLNSHIPFLEVFFCIKSKLKQPIFSCYSQLMLFIRAISRNRDRRNIHEVDESSFCDQNICICYFSIIIVLLCFFSFYKPESISPTQFPSDLISGGNSMTTQPSIATTLLFQTVVPPPVLDQIDS